MGKNSQLKTNTKYLVSKDDILTWDEEGWPTDEMNSRTEYRNLLVGVLVALPSGVGVALSVLAGNAGSMVGVAISASLLPPAVNAGLYWSMSMISAIHGDLNAQHSTSNVTIEGEARLSLSSTSHMCHP